MFNRKIWTISWKIHRPYEWMAIGGWTPTYTKEVTGNWYIDLTDAVANKLLELKAYGWCEQDLTPTPTTPVDIKCNNWVLKVKDKELPVWYVRLESIELDAWPYYNTNEKLYWSDVVSMRISQSWSSWRNVFWAYTSNTSEKNFSFYAYPTATWQAYLRYWDSLYRPVVWTGTKNLTFWSGGTTWFATNVTIPEQTFETEDVVYIGHLPNSNSGRFDWTFYWNIEVSSGGTTRLKWIPCKRKSDGVIWYYEAVNGNFIEPSGSGTPTAWAEDYSNIEVYVDWTKEKVWYSGWATATCEDLLWVWDYKDEQEILSGNVITKVWVAVLTWAEDWWYMYDANNVFRLEIDWCLVPTEESGLSSAVICNQYQVDARTNSNMVDNSCKIAKNSSLTYGWLYIKSTAHSTLSAFKTFLANQLNAWTPVIVVYPLATPTTLSVAWQTLSIPAWDSRIEIVEWSILDLPLYAKYKSTTE